MGKKRKKKKDPIISMLQVGFIPDAQFDFHDLGPLRDFEIEDYLNEFLEDAYVVGSKRVLIITGKGMIIRPQVNKLLKQHKFVESHKTAGYFNGQDGAYEVILKN